MAKHKYGFSEDKFQRYMAEGVGQGTGADSRRHQNTIQRVHTEVNASGTGKTEAFVRLVSSTPAASHQGGQIPDALLGRFQDSGHESACRMTANRGPVARKVKGGVFQIDQENLVAIHKVIKTYFLKDERCTQVSAFQRLLETNYVYVDANGKKWLHEPGNRPSRRQFEHILRRDFSPETRLRKRKGFLLPH